MTVGTISDCVDHVVLTRAPLVVTVVTIGDCVKFDIVCLFQKIDSCLICKQQVSKGIPDASANAPLLSNVEKSTQFVVQLHIIGRSLE